MNFTSNLFRLKPLPVASALVLALGAATGAQAQDAASPSSGTAWGVGLGVALDRKPYRDFDDKAMALPWVMAENRWISLMGPRLDFKLPSAGPVSFRLRASYFGEGYEADDSPYLVGMDKRNSSFWLGGAVLLNTDLANFSVEALGDASNESKGARVKLGVERSFSFGNLQLTPRLGAQWVDRKYVDYYYGVRAEEALPGRAFYEGEATTNFEAGLRVGYALTPQQHLLLDMSATRLGSSIQDSPLVERSSQVGVRLGYLYRF